MTIHMPFEPLDAYESLQFLLPPFCLQSSREDLRSFIIHGSLTRRFVLRGRFREFGHKRLMRREDEMTVKAFLRDSVPRESENPLYGGDAVGFVVEGTGEIYTEEDHRYMTEFPDDTLLTFLYSRPALWSPVRLANDLRYGVRYLDEFETNEGRSSPTLPRGKKNLFRIISEESAASFSLVDAFQLAVEERSRFGYSGNTLHAMKGLALVHRVYKQFEEAEGVLGKALEICQSIQSSDNNMANDLLYEMGALHLDKGNPELARQYHSQVEKHTRDNRFDLQQTLHMKAVEGLAVAALQNGLIQQAESLLDSLLDRPDILDNHQPVRLALKSRLGIVHWCQGELGTAEKYFRNVLAEQELSLGERHHRSIRTLHNLAGVLSERCVVSESLMLYEEEVARLKLVLGPRHSDTLRSQELLATQYNLGDKLEEATAMWERLTQVYEEELGPQHASTLGSRYQLCQAFQRLGRFSEALKILKPLCTKLNDLHGSIHPATRRAQNLLANLSPDFHDRKQFNNVRREPPKSSKAPDSAGTGAIANAHISELELRLEANLPQRIKDTRSWIFENPIYQNWVNTPAPSLLWLRGPPGIGKTTMASLVINRLRDEQQPTIFYYFDMSTAELRDPQIFLDSLIVQMLQLNPGLNRQAILQNSAISPLAKSLATFTELLLGFDQLFCCIDAIDESEVSLELFLRRIVDIVRSRSFPVKFMLSSRPRVDLTYLQDVSQLMDLSAMTLSDPKVLDDIREYARGQLTAMKLPDIDPEIEADRLAKASNGMFIWVTTILSQAQTNPNLLRSHPQSLSDLFSKSLQRHDENISGAEKNLRAAFLRWVATAIRPMRVDELQIALAVAPGDNQLDQMSILYSPSQLFLDLGGGLISINPEGTIFVTHRSVIDYLRNRIAADVLGFEDATSSTELMCNSYLSQVCITYLSFDCFHYPYDIESPEKNSFLDYAASFWHLHMRQSGRDTSLIPLVLHFINSEQCFNWVNALTRVFGKSVEDVLLIQSHVTNWLQQFADADVAQSQDFVLRLYRRKIAEFEHRPDLENEKSLALDNLASICRAKGLFGEAESLSKRALGVSVDTKSKGQPQDLQDFLMAMNQEEFAARLPKIANIASTYRSQGRLVEAESLFFRAMSHNRQTLGDRHPNTLQSICSLASTYYDQGRWSEAQRLFEEALETIMYVHEEEPAPTILEMNPLASIYRSQGRWAEAENLASQVLEVQQKLLGLTHPATLNTMSNLALTYREQGRLPEAENLNTQVLETLCTVLGPEHPSTLDSLSNQASIRRRQGRWPDAERLEARALAAWQTQLGDDHPSTLASMANLATTYASQGRMKDAEKLDMQVIETWKRKLGEDHPSTLTALKSMHNLARTQQNMGNTRASIDMLQECVDLEQLRLGPHHPQTQSSLSLLDKWRSRALQGTASRTYRVRGIDVEWDEEKLQNFLAIQKGDDEKDQEDQSHREEHVSTGTRGLKIFSLALETGTQSQTATVTFPDGYTPPKSIRTDDDVISIDDNFHGITTFFAPHEDDHEVDIIAISGLGGHAFGSFKHRRDNHMWLRDFLPEDLSDRGPDGNVRTIARVMTYGYESTSGSSESFQTMEDIARNFSATLKKHQLTKPIVFIAHSLGGLVVKEVILRWYFEGDKELLQAVHGILFFGVPHQGMELGSSIPLVGSLNRGLVEALHSHASPIQMRQTRNFLAALRGRQKTEIFSFYETLTSPTAMRISGSTGQWAMTGPPSVLVDKASSTLQRPVDDGPTHEIECRRSHSELVKFKRSDVDYTNVRHVLRSLCARVIQNKKKEQASSLKMTEANEVSLKRRKQIMESLHFSQIGQRLAMIDQPHARTYEWILNHPTFRHWRTASYISEEHRIIWIKGHPGSGKSTLMKFAYKRMHAIAEEQSNGGPTFVTSFFFNDRGQDLEKTVIGMYRSLLWTLLERFPDLQAVLDDNNLLGPHRDSCSLNELQDLLEGAVLRLGQRSLIFFIDALDECEEDEVAGIVRYFEDITKSCMKQNVNLAICFSSRHYPMIRMPRSVELVLDRNPDHDRDLRTFITDRLEVDDVTLVSEVLKRASGVFVWAVLVLDILNKEYLTGGLALKRRLNELPSNLLGLFKRLLTQGTDDKMEKTTTQFSMLWLLFAEHSLSPKQYRHAIWGGLASKKLVQSQDFPVDEAGEDAELRLEKYVISSSKGLAHVGREGSVQLIHESVRYFLLKARGLEGFWPEVVGARPESLNFNASHTTANIAGYSHEILKGACMAYWESWRTVVPKKSPLGKLERTDFSRYALKHVLDHAEAAAAVCSQQDFLANFPLSNFSSDHPDIRRFSPIDGKVDLLYILSYEGHAKLITTFLQFGVEVVGQQMAERAGKHRFPLLAAAANGHQPAFEALLSAPTHIYVGADLFDELQPHTFQVPSRGKYAEYTPLTWAASHGYTQMVSRLLHDYEQPINERGDDEKTPLWRACAEGHMETARVLLENGADANDGDPLCVAFSEEIARLLIEKRAGANTPDEIGSYCNRSFSANG